MNAFLDLAEEQIVAPVKAKLKRREARQQIVLSPQEKKIRENQQLSRQFIKWKKERREALRTNGKEISDLLDLLDTITFSSGPVLVSYLESAEWLRSLERNIKDDLLSAIADAIIKVREKEGLPPFDDALPGEPPKIFEKIKEIWGKHDQGSRM